MARSRDFDLDMGTGSGKSDIGAHPGDRRKNSGVVKTVLHRNSRPYREMTIGGLLAAVVGCVLVMLLLKRFYMEWSNLVLVGVSMAIMALLILLVCGMIEVKKMGVTGKHRVLGAGRVLAFGLAGALVIGLAGVALEFIYELGYEFRGAQYDDYIFVIDDSGSMYSSDRGNQRYSALESLLGNMDENNMVGVLRFSDSVNREAAPAVLDDSHRQIVQTTLDADAVSGGTNIQQALVRAVELFKTAKREGHTSAIVLLSDGASSGVDVDGLANQLNPMDVDICTVALGSGADRQLLKSLADATGGIMLDVSDADMLRVTYKLLNGGAIKRCLLMPRIGEDKANVLHGIMCVLFMGILGSLISLALVKMFDSDAAKVQLKVGAAASFAGALIHELFNDMGLGGLGRVIMLVLFGLVLLQLGEYRYSQTSDGFAAKSNFTRGSGLDGEAREIRENRETGNGSRAVIGAEGEDRPKTGRRSDLW